MRLFLLCFVIILFSIRLQGQEYNYIHFDARDGFASSTVYLAVQDKKGYLWFATDNGISRFDGKNITTFTTDDGLPDNEVLGVFCDSKNRIWCTTFNKSLGYFEDEKFHNVHINKYLPDDVLTSSIGYCGEDAKGNNYFFSTSGLFVYLKSGNIRLLADYNKLSAEYNIPKQEFTPVDLTDRPPYSQCLILRDLAFLVNETGIRFYKKNKNPITNHGLPIVFNFDNTEPLFLKKKYLPAFNTLCLYRENLLYNTFNGSWVIDKNGELTGTVFLKGKKIAGSLIDTEGNIWFTTLGEGIFRLTSGSMKTFSGGTEAFSLERSGGIVYAGLSDGRMEQIDKLRLSKEYLPDTFPLQVNTRRLYTLKSDGSKSLYLGYDSHLEKWENGKIVRSDIAAIKSIDIADSKHIVICNNKYVFKLRSSDLKITDTILFERGTKVLCDNGTYYIGTLNGLIILDPDGNMKRTAAQSPLLESRVVDIRRSDDGSIWVATNDKGVVRYHNGMIEAVIGFKNGLSSNGCKSMFVKDKFLWVGTNKGINKIDSRNNKVVAKYSTSDGLPSDNINALYVEDSLVWVASPGGVTFFSEKDISDTSICELDFHTILVSGNKIDSAANLELGYRDNNITFKYTAISFKSAGDIIYKYKLTGLDDEWKETNLTTLSYPSLPPGNYTFQLYAINKFGKQSRIVTVYFTIKTPFWKTIWFWLIISLSVISITAWLISRRYRVLQQRVKEKNELKNKVTELEQASLRAQMNPHFIFNCLNSIQHYIIKNDIEQTNKYITRFGSLIRQTLDNAARTNITIADELRYLTDYMELERMRFPEAFNYDIKVDPSIQTDYINIPGMVLQPFIENAIRHGIRNKQKGTGLIRITISEDNEGLYFSVEDNGVGREEAARLKSQQHIEYQSKGITLATNRLDLLSEGKEKKIITTFIDLKDKAGNPSGTRVTIFFPQRIIEKLN